MNSQDENQDKPDLEEDKNSDEISEIDLIEDNLDKIDNKNESLEKNESENYKEKYDDLYDRFIRLAADFDNYKKRLTKEKSEILNYGNEELIKALLNVIDNLERAIGHADSDITSENDYSALIDGVKLVHSQFLSCLEKFDVKLVESIKGSEFDPRVHQAIERVESDEFETGLIISEMLKGYLLKDRLLRPSMVSVSKGLTDKIEIVNDEIETELTDDSDSSENEDDIIDLSDEFK
ncbi:MAG: nucleotide exchange factor GrpE [Candidatus Dadabacteria bacterium]|nr:nucleotide exchange factor GrpE [Candidatus Dadabacteria bacterium]NIQ16051.1 nucleotide exchange factor GrpE [Candidatus Dadabacteria bacterium]